MFRLSWVALCLFFAAPCDARAQRALLKPANYPRDLLRDSVYRFSQSLSPRAEYVLSVVRYHDNGYYAENASVGVVLWQVASQRRARRFTVGAPSLALAPPLPLDTLFAVYLRQRLGQLPGQPAPVPDGPMQGPAYSVELLITNARGTHNEGFNVRAPARHARVPGPGNGPAWVLDPRCAWLDLWEKLMP